MAQLWKVRYPRSRVLSGLGVLPEVPTWAASGQLDLLDELAIKAPRFTEQEIRAGMALTVGLISAASIVLMAKGRTQAAYILGGAGAVTGAFFAALRILREDER